LGAFAAMCAKTAEPIQMAFGDDLCDPKEVCIRQWTKSEESIPAARGDDGDVVIFWNSLESQ